MHDVREDLVCFWICHGAGERPYITAHGATLAANALPGAGLSIEVTFPGIDTRRSLINTVSASSKAN